jgi:hypothetical protein
MAASRFVEEESGTYTTRFQHPHNGYYAGDFSHTPWCGSEHPSRSAVAAVTALREL